MPSARAKKTKEAWQELARQEAGRRSTRGGNPMCGHEGPGGQCNRVVGHTDDKPLTGPEWHYGWETDHFYHWPVGWISESETIDILVEALNRIINEASVDNWTGTIAKEALEKVTFSHTGKLYVES